MALQNIKKINQGENMKEELIKKLNELKADQAAGKPLASIEQAVETFISICEFLLNSQQTEQDKVQKQ